MKKRDRLHIRLSTKDAALLRAAAERLDMTISELVRVAAVAAATRVERGDLAALEPQAA